MTPTHIVLLTTICLGACRPGPITKVTPSNGVPLDSVIKQVEEAVNQYQSSSEPHSLPRLQSAEFSFKAVASTVKSSAINFFIFKFGGSHEKDLTHEVTFTYAVRRPLELLKAQTPAPTTFKDDLVKMIQSGAQAVKKSETAMGLPFEKLTVNVEYGVKWEGNVEVNPVLSLVTVGVSGDKSKNTVQSIQLVFEK
jgi:hypothetical protein